MLITSFGSMISLMPNLAISMGAVAAGTTAANLGFKKATISVLTFQTALGPLWLVLLAITAAIAAVVTIGISLYKAYYKDADAAKEAAKNAAELTKQYEELKNKAEELKKTISDYKDAKNELKDLKQGTEEYNEALEKANATAKKLMETYNLYDKVEYKNGLLTFKEGTLESLQGQINADAQSAAKRMYASKIQLNNANIRSAITETRRSTDRAFNPLGLIDDLVMMRTPIPKNSMVLLNDTIKITDEQVKDITNSLQRLKNENEIQYEKIKNSSSAMEE